MKTLRRDLQWLKELPLLSLIIFLTSVAFILFLAGVHTAYARATLAVFVVASMVAGCKKLFQGRILPLLVQQFRFWLLVGSLLVILFADVVDLMLAFNDARYNLG